MALSSITSPKILKHQRTEDFTGVYKKHFEITSEVSTRDQTGFEKTFSGLMKILYPDGKATPRKCEELLAFRNGEHAGASASTSFGIDDTFKRHDFIYRPLAGGAAVTVLTPEEIQYPTFAAPQDEASEDRCDAGSRCSWVCAAGRAPKLRCESEETACSAAPQPGTSSSPRTQKAGVIVDSLPNTSKGARKITVSDPYVRQFFQVRNLMEFL